LLKKETSDKAGTKKYSTIRSHIVGAKETLYGIKKRIVTEVELKRQNPFGKKTQMGQILIIPSKNSANVVSTTAVTLQKPVFSKLCQRKLNTQLLNNTELPLKN
jgi:hypothetical protein